MLLGSDAPLINVNQISEAFLSLEGHSLKKSFAVGPARDGGFYLFAANQHLPKKFWTNISYSQSSTFSQLMLSLNSLSDNKVHLLPENFDFDNN